MNAEARPRARAATRHATCLPRLVLALWLFAAGAAAHEVRPAYLELRQSGPETYDVTFKLPGRGADRVLALDVVLPADCEPTGPRRTTRLDRARVQHWSITRPGGLPGARLGISGLSATATDALVRIERLDGTEQLVRLTPSSPSFVVSAAPGPWEVARAYTRLGVEHILTGLDHLLFVLALLILTDGGWRLVKTVTAFTVSHSLTLTAATLGWVSVPAAPVEAVIALSIVFVAAEIVHARRGRPGLTARAPWLVAFGFGLMHGLGFAGGLHEAGLPSNHIPTALLFFSVGVEAGHLAFVGAVVGVVVLARRRSRSGTGPGASRAAASGRAPLVTAYAIGGLAAFWLLERTLTL